MDDAHAQPTLVWDAERSRQPVRILLAEGEAESDLRELLAHRFRSLGYDVVEAEDGKELLEEFSEWHPDLIIAGLDLGPIDGLDALARLRRLNHDTPYILISPMSDPDVRARAARLGATVVCDRPLDVQHLIGSVWSIVGP